MSSSTESSHGPDGDGRTGESCSSSNGTSNSTTSKFLDWNEISNIILAGNSEPQINHDTPDATARVEMYRALFASLKEKKDRQSFRASTDSIKHKSKYHVSLKCVVCMAVSRYHVYVCADICPRRVLRTYFR